MGRKRNVNNIPITKSSKSRSESMPIKHTNQTWSGEKVCVMIGINNRRTTYDENR